MNWRSVTGSIRKMGKRGICKKAIKREDDRDGTDADPVFFGNSENKAYDEQREESAYYTACADTGNPPAGGGSGRTIVRGKGAEHCADGIWEVFTEKIRTADAAVR